MHQSLNHGDNDWLTNDDDGVWWFNLDVMVDELVIIMRCSVIWNSKIYVLSMISKYYVLYVYDGACLCFSCWNIVYVVVRVVCACGDPIFDVHRIR